MLVLLFVALWLILLSDLFRLTLCYFVLVFFPVLLALRVPRLGKRELILVLFECLFDLCLFNSSRHSLDFSFVFFFFFFFFFLFCFFFFFFFFFFFLYTMSP